MANKQLLFTQIVAPLYQDAIELEDNVPPPMFLSNEVSWSFAQAFGRSGGKSVPLLCDSNGIQHVSIRDLDDGYAVKADSSGNMDVRIRTGSSSAVVLRADAGVTSSVGLCTTNVYTKLSYDILSDVHDSVNNALRTKAVA